VETAKQFCAAQAPKFVNGVLGAALRAVRENGAPYA
jgi:transcription termination factor NusB